MNRTSNKNRTLLRDDSGIMEPYSDLPAMMLVIIGFIVFMVVAVQAYDSYADRTFVLEHQQDAHLLLENVKKDLSISERPGVISAQKLENLDVASFSRRYGSGFGFKVKVVSTDPNHEYTKLISSDNSDSDVGVTASTLVSVQLNDALIVPGTITVKIWRT